MTKPCAERERERERERELLRNTYFLSVVDNILNNKNQLYTIDEENSINNDNSKLSNCR